jgi:uncharacterized protein YndB with AHSA1/START domain
MITESAESIARPPADVFAYVSDVRNDPNWHTDILEAGWTDEGARTAGAKFWTKFKPFMGLSEGPGVVSAYEAPHRFVIEEEMGKLGPTTIYTVDADGAGSRITPRIEMAPVGLLRVMAPLMGGMMRKRNAGFLANLKRVLEAIAPPSGKVRIRTCISARCPALIGRRSARWDIR